MPATAQVLANRIITGAEPALAATVQVCEKSKPMPLAWSPELRGWFDKAA